MFSKLATERAKDVIEMMSAKQALVAGRRERIDCLRRHNRKSPEIVSKSAIMIFKVSVRYRHAIASTFGTVECAL